MEARFRIGVGSRQEVGVTGYGLFAPDLGVAGGAEVAYKLAPSRAVAFVADAGFLDDAFVGDVALVTAPYTDARGNQLYVGARESAAMLLGGQRNSSAAVTLPVGFAFRVSPRVRLFLEAGVLGAWSSYSTSTTSITTFASRYGSVGGYGALGFTYRP